MNQRKKQGAGILLAGLLASAAAVAVGLDHAAEDDAAVTARGTSVTIDVLANDPDTTAQSQVHLRQRPAHGSARVVGRQVVYTPVAGFTGRDSLTYLVKSPRRLGIARVTIDVGDTLRLQGRVAEGGAGAAVSVQVGGHRFDAVADAAGGYAVDVIGRGEDMVRLESSRGGAVLASIVGGFARLRGEAGDDGVLTRDENNQVQVTRLSAAHAYLAQLANGGMPIGNEEQFAAAQGAMDLDELLQMAAVVKLVADGSHALPAGIADTMALISDTDAYQQFVDAALATDPAAIDTAIADTLADPEVVMPANAAAMTGAKWLTPPGAGGTIRVGLISGQRLVLDAGGTGVYIDTRPTLDTGATWSMVGNAAAVVLQAPRQYEYLSYRDGAQVRTISSTVRLDVTPLVDGGGSGRDLVGVTYHGILSYPDNPEYPDVVTASTGTVLAYREGVAGIPFGAGEFPALRALQLHRPEIYVPDGGERATGSNYALHQFNAGGDGIVTYDGQPFTWSLDANGHLHLAYGDGEAAEFVRLVQDGRKGEGVIAVFQLPDGRRKAHFSLSSVHDGSLVFNVANLAESWRSGFDISQTAYDFQNFFGFFIVLDGAGQTGHQVHVDGTWGTTWSPLVWDVAGGAMVARRYRDNGGWQVECVVGVNGCYLAMERRWVPVSREGNRIYVHEELWSTQDATGVQPVALFSQRGNFYDIDAPPSP